MSSSASTHSTPDPASPEHHAKPAVLGRSSRAGALGGEATWGGAARPSGHSWMPPSGCSAVGAVGQTSRAEVGEETGYGRELAWSANCAASATSY
ncbi:hypothetical protein AB0D27_24335 [Streptomyces sp. NPDC048415]|uniref:hypothetical protein n=1 Tax=Streptomyces sp. NPDC048415 TaxID=3154822 RepID=UPI00341F70F7